LAAQKRQAVRRAQWADEFARLQTGLAPLLADLQRWDGAGDQRADELETVLAAWPQLPRLQPLIEACGLRLLRLAEQPAVDAAEPKELPDRVRLVCSLALRGEAIVQRQVIADARTYLGVPGWVADVPKRYRELGRLAWHQWRELLHAEASWQRRAGRWLDAARTVGAELPRVELLGPALAARRQLERELDRGLVRWSWPSSVTDGEVAVRVRTLWQSGRDPPWDGPAWLAPAAVQHRTDAYWQGRATLGEVRAVDGVWQTLVDAKGRRTRRLRDFAASFEVEASEPSLSGCWLTWGTLEQQGSQWSVRWSDDVRKLPCSGPEQAVPATQTAGRPTRPAIVR
jgi:hypothetical protein